MKFAHYLTQIENVSIFPVTSLIIFGTVFTIAAVYAFTTRKKDMDDRAQIPLDEKNERYEK